jgi:hypothetical protein
MDFRGQSFETAVSDLQAQINTIDSQITTINTTLTSLQSQITALQSGNFSGAVTQYNSLGQGPFITPVSLGSGLFTVAFGNDQTEWALCSLGPGPALPDGSILPFYKNGSVFYYQCSGVLLGVSASINFSMATFITTPVGPFTTVTTSNVSASTPLMCEAWVIVYNVVSSTSASIKIIIRTMLGSSASANAQVDIKTQDAIAVNPTTDFPVLYLGKRDNSSFTSYTQYQTYQAQLQ